MNAANEYEISDDRSRHDLGMIHEYLSRSSYWAKNIPRRLVEKSIEHSLCFGAFRDGRQAAFARVITDFATVAYVGDVFVLPEHRGRGVSKLLMRAILDHPHLQGLRGWLLMTKDAQGLYRQFGFKHLTQPRQFMIIRRQNVYAKKSTQRRRAGRRTEQARGRKKSRY